VPMPFSKKKIIIIIKYNEKFFFFLIIMYTIRISGGWVKPGGSGSRDGRKRKWNVAQLGLALVRLFFFFFFWWVMNVKSLVLSVMVYFFF
jgi:hypothetical protein